MFISVTRLRLKNKGRIPSFFWHTLKSYFQIKRSKGIVKIALDKESPLIYWTLTAWVSEDLMRQYRNQGSHLQAMQKSKELASELEYTHWIAQEIPTWEEGKQRLHEKYNRVY